MNEIGWWGKAKLQFWSKLPSFTVLMTICFLYFMYMDTFLSPLFIKENKLVQTSSVYSEMVFRSNHLQLNRSFWYFTVLIFLFIMFIISYLKVVFTCPGYVPTDWQQKRGEAIMKEYCEQKIANSHKGMFTILLANKKMDPIEFFSEEFTRFLAEKDYKYCIVCRHFKPERVHHCRQTGACVLKMDHFCNWVSNCIGYRNYKYFLVFIFYTSMFFSLGLILLFITSTYTEHFVSSISDNRVVVFDQLSDLKFFGIAFTFALSLSYTLIIVSFTVFHYLYLVWGNRTTLEYCEKEHVTEHFDRGAWQNWTEVFGKNPLVWFIPFCKIE